MQEAGSQVKGEFPYLLMPDEAQMFRLFYRRPTPHFFGSRGSNRPFSVVCPMRVVSVLLFPAIRNDEVNKE